MKTLPTLTVGPRDADIVGTSNRELQAAVDRVAALGGGVVRILPGVYDMEDSLHLRRRVRVVGAGDTTVLRQAPSVRSPISTYLGYGHYDISVTEPDIFRVGMGVHIHDDRAHGFYDTVATLIWRDGNRFGIDRMLNHDYSPAANGVVTTVSPVISGREIRDCVVENLAIDGNKPENEPLNGCRGGGVFLLQAHHVVLRGLHVRNYNGDGISFQQCRNTLVEECLLEDMAGHGLHPGSGSVGAVLRRNICRRNGGEGIFYCLRVVFSLCEGNRIGQNRGHGISIGGRDTNHRIRANQIRRNGGCGIYFREADRATAGSRNLLEENLLEHNCRENGSAEIHIDGATEDILIVGNTIRPETATAEGTPSAIRIGDKAGRIVLWKNTFGGDPDLAVQCRGGRDSVREEEPGTPFPVGPEAAGDDAAAHLG